MPFNSLKHVILSRTGIACDCIASFPIITPPFLRASRRFGSKCEGLIRGGERGKPSPISRSAVDWRGRGELGSALSYLAALEFIDALRLESVVWAGSLIPPVWHHPFLCPLLAAPESCPDHFSVVPSSGSFKNKSVAK